MNIENRSALAGLKRPESKPSGDFQKAAAKEATTRFNVNIPASMMKNIKVFCAENDTSLTELFLQRFSDLK